MTHAAIELARNLQAAVNGAITPPQKEERVVPCFYCGSDIMRMRVAARPCCERCHRDGTAKRWRLEHPEEMAAQTSPEGMDAIIRVQRGMMEERQTLRASLREAEQEIRLLSQKIDLLAQITELPTELDGDEWIQEALP